MHLLPCFQRPDSDDDDLSIFVQPNIVSIEEGFAFNKLSSIYVLLVKLVSFDYQHWQRPYFAEFEHLLNDFKFSGLSGL